MSDNDRSAEAIMGLVLFPLYVLYEGYVVCLLWGWFIATTFSIKALSVLEAVGVCLVVSAVRYQSKKSDEENVVERMVRGFLELSFLLAIGWIVKSFM